MMNSEGTQNQCYIRAKTNLINEDEFESDDEQQIM